MKETNDFESTSCPNVPNIDAIKATRCIKCDKVFFTNYNPKLNDYECFRCRPAEMHPDNFGIKKTNHL